jgi:UV DNA damage endonuclease
VIIAAAAITVMSAICFVSTKTGKTTHMRLGFAVKVLGRPDLPSHDARRWQSKPSLTVSIGYLNRIFDYLDEIDVRMYRMASGIAPYASHPGLKQFRNQPHNYSADLAELGIKARDFGLRLSSHPGQYTVLNSEDDATVRTSVEELEVQAEIFDAMHLPPEAVIVIHVGGKAGGARQATDRFLRGFEMLSPQAQGRLVIENDDRSYSLADVTKLSATLGRPVVWDVLHHHCYDPDHIPDQEAIRIALKTWPRGVTPKTHYSSPRTMLQERKKKVGRKTIRTYVPSPMRAHADLIDPIGFETFLREVVGDLDVDVMLEAKGKDVALLTLRGQLQARGLAPE